jgi:hypothetical protein
MAQDLLQEFNLDTSRAPTPGVSPGQVAQPYEELSRALGKVGEAATDIATTAAERAGFEAVTTDEHGNIQIKKAPIIGPASNAYERAVKMAALAQGEGAAKDADITLRNQFPNDPQGYLSAANAYKNGVMKQYADLGVPEVGISLGRAIDSTTTYNFRALSNQKREADVKNALSGIDAGISDATDYLTARARQGAFTDPDNLPPDVKEKYDKVRTLINEKVTNPLFGHAYSQEAADGEFNHLDSQLRGNSVVFHADSVYHDTSLNPDGTPRGGYAKGLEAANSILTDPSLKLSEQERQHYASLARSAIHEDEAIRHADINELKSALTDVKARSALGERIEPAEIEQLRSAARATNWPGGIAAFDAAVAHVNLHDDHGQLPLRQQMNDIAVIRGAASARDATDFLVQRGYTREQAAGVVGNLVWESGMRPAVPGDAGTSFGLAQWHAERFTALKTYAASQGKPWQDPQIQLQFLDRELRTTESVAGGLLHGAKTPEEAASIFAAGYERPKSVDYSGRQALARSIYEGKPTDGSQVGPGVSSWLLANREATLNTAATTKFKDVKTDWDSGKGNVRKGDLIDVIDAARQTHNIDLSVKTQRLSDLMDEVERVEALPLDRQAALETELRRQMAAGTAYDGADEVLKQLEAKTKAIDDGLKTNPNATTIANNSGRFSTPEPINWDNPQSIDAGLKRRLEITQFGANKWQSGAPTPILDRIDAAQMTGALKGGNGAGLLTALGQEPPLIRQALLQEKDLREGVVGMSRSGDPAKMNAAYSLMDTLQKQNPLEFEKQFPDGLKDLRAWQSNLAFYPPDQAAKRMMQAYDPAEAAGREAVDKVVNKALENVSAANVVSKFSTGIIFGTSAQAPVAEQAGIAAGALKADYDKNYRDGFIATGDPAAAENFAVEKLKLKYDLSPTNGNRVMPYPPERYYPQVGGSHDWMARQLDDAVRGQVGATRPEPEFAAAVEPGAFISETTAQRQYEAHRSLIADVTTEREIAAGKPPSYQVVIRDPNGRWSAMSGADGLARRVRFDPTQPFAERAAGAEYARPTIQGLQTPLGGGVTP